MKVHNKSDGRVRMRSNKKGPEDQSDTEVIDEQSHGGTSVEQVHCIILVSHTVVIKRSHGSVNRKCVCKNSDSPNS